MYPFVPLFFLCNARAVTLSGKDPLYIPKLFGFPQQCDKAEVVGSCLLDVINNNLLI